MAVPGDKTGSAPRRELGIPTPSDTLKAVMTASDAPLTMYTTSWCGYCFGLKSALKAEGIPYAEIDIESDPVAADFVMSVNGGNQTVPTVKFTDGSTLTNPSAGDVKARLA